MTAADGRRTAPVAPEAASLIRARYDPCTDTKSQLTSYLHAIVEEGMAAHCALRLAELGSIEAGRNGDGESDDGGTIPVEYGDQPFGSFAWSPGRRAGDRAAGDRILRDLAWYFGCQLNRSRLGAQTRERLGREFTLVGVSDALLCLEQSVERAARVDLPTLIHGEFGTEKVQVACAIHFGGERRSESFVELRCATLGAVDETSLHEALARARGGSLFLNGVDELRPELQSRLLRSLGSRVGQWSDPGQPPDSAVRLIASTTHDLRELVETSTFSPALFTELSFLRVEVPPLRRRRDDLAHLTHYALARREGSVGERPADRVDADVLEAFAAYEWPQNLFEMERILSRLVVMGGSRQVRLADLETLAPRLVGNGAGSNGNNGCGRACREPAGAEVGGEPAVSAPHTQPEDGDGIPIEQIARRVLSGDLGPLDHWHAGILRALRCIGEHYQDSMTLGELAGAAYVSPSHLCYLFRSTLGVTFKGLLGLVRIDRAKQLLADEPRRRITDISLDVGFGDLSHFEKTFKRIVKVSPREYRRRRLLELRRRSEPFNVPSPRPNVHDS